MRNDAKSSRLNVSWALTSDSSSFRNSGPSEKANRMRRWPPESAMERENSPASSSSAASINAHAPTCDAIASGDIEMPASSAAFNDSNCQPAPPRTVTNELRAPRCCASMSLRNILYLAPRLILLTSTERSNAAILIPRACIVLIASTEFSNSLPPRPT